MPEAANSRIQDELRRVGSCYLESTVTAICENLCIDIVTQETIFRWVSTKVVGHRAVFSQVAGQE